MDKEINDGDVAGTGAGGAARAAGAGGRTGDGDDDRTEHVDRLADGGVNDRWAWLIGAHRYTLFTSIHRMMNADGCRI